MNLKLLKLLQNNGTPLVITVEENGKGKQDRITRDGVTVEEQYESLKQIKEALAFYPEEVWINKEKMETTQWPGLAEVRITEQDKGGLERNSKRKVDLRGPDPRPTLQRHRRRRDDISAPDGPAEERYEGPVLHPKEDSALKHHVLLETVTLTAFIEIQAGETENPDGKYLLAIPEGSDMEATVMTRAKAMIERTIDRKELPKPHEGQGLRQTNDRTPGSRAFHRALPHRSDGNTHRHG